MRHLHDRLPSEQQGGWFPAANEDVLELVTRMANPGHSGEGQQLQGVQRTALLVKGSNVVFWSTGFTQQLRAALEQLAAESG